MNDYISREATYQSLTEYYHHTTEGMHSALREAINRVPAADVRPEIPETGIGDLSDGYHTFNGLYYQRMVLFAALEKGRAEKHWHIWAAEMLAERP